MYTILIEKLKIHLRLLLISVALSTMMACSSYNSMDRFYNEHKDDNEVMAIRVPQLMINLLAGISPEMQAILGNTRDMRYMRFSGLDTKRTRILNTQMNSMTTRSFIEVYRKNENLKRNIISIREKRNTVKEIIVYNNDNINASFLYFNGNFDPAQVRSLAKNDEFKEVSENLFGKFNAQNTSE